MCPGNRVIHRILILVIYASYVRIFGVKIYG